MGLCGSGSKTPEALESQKVDGEIAESESKDKQVHKLLLLGAGESGKSTLFKQMIQIYGKGFDDKDKRDYTNIIFNNILNSMKELLKQVPDWDNKDKQVIEKLTGKEPVDAALAAAIKTLWSHSFIQKAYENRASFQLTDSAAYFFDKIDEIAKPGYVPTNEHIFRARVKTTGIVENEFEIEGQQFKMLDVGGQRNERKKWIHCFEGVTAVLFVAAISEYDQVCVEDNVTNRMEEALNLFEEICNSRWFRSTSMILMLNKRDLFAEKIKKVPLSVWKRDYKGPNSYEAGCALMKEKFESRKRSPCPKTVYTHITCATDTENVQHMFEAVKETIVREAIDSSGLV